MIRSIIVSYVSIFIETHKSLKKKVMINGLKYCDSQICENSGRKARTSSHQGLYYNRDRNAALNIYI